MNLPTIHWPHALACLLVGVTAVLLCFGALVTTYDAAMAVPDWPGTFGHNMFLYPLKAWLWGPWDLFLEHGHRLLGALVGVLTLGMAAAVWRRETDATLRALAVAAVLLVVVQGVLGGARVLLDDKTVAKVHACTGPLFFSVAIAIATLTRPPRLAAAKPELSATGGDDVLRPDRWKAVAALSTAPWVTAGLLGAAYVQLVAGAQLRHLDAAVDANTFRWLVALHLAGALLVTVLSIVATGTCWWLEAGAPRRLALMILVLVGCQLLLGAGAWVVSWGFPADWLPQSWTPAQATVARSARGAAVVTGHVVLGMLILGASVVLALSTWALRSSQRPGLGKERAFA
jgi:cytochrome c oxidase assembly protein subunit 15